MFKNLHLLIFSILLLSLTVGCKRDNNENQTLTVSRLYVSSSDTDSTVSNLVVYDPADKNPYPSPYNFQNTRLPDAGGVFFDSKSGTVFQVGRTEKKIRVLLVGQYGDLTDKINFVDSTLKSPRALAYNKLKDSALLYISSDVDSSISVYTNPLNLSGVKVRASKKFKLNGKPWGIQSKGDSLIAINSVLNKPEIHLYLKTSKLVSGLINPNDIITITGATQLRGCIYIDSLDILIVTDIGIEGNQGDGKIYIIENTNSKFSTNAMVVPERTISGINTTLGDPIDVSYDRRKGNELIYIADKLNKTILVFALKDKENASPFIVQPLTSSPSAIYLDAR